VTSLGHTARERDTRRTDRNARPRRSAMADAAALRLADLEPTGLPPAFAALEGGQAHGCAHAEAAALRWHERHPDEP
jgi:hypothetical protein